MNDPINPNEQVVISNAEDINKPNLGPTFRPDNGRFQRLVDYCTDLRKAIEASTYRNEKIKQITQSRKVYKQIGDAKEIPWPDSYNLVLPLDTITVDNLEPRLVSGLIGRDPIVRFEMNAVQEQTEPVQILQSWFNQELKAEVRIDNLARTIIHTILIEGTWFGIPQYNRHEDTRRDFVFNPNGTIKIHGQFLTNEIGQPLLNEFGAFLNDPQVGTPHTTDNLDVLYEGGEVERIPFTDVFCADDIGTDAEWERVDKGFITRPTYAQLQRDKNKIGYLPDKIGPWLIPMRGQTKRTGSDQSPEQEVANVEVTGKETIKCVNWIISYPIHRDEEAPREEQDNFAEEKVFATITYDTGVLIRFALLRDFNFSNRSLLRRVRLFPEDGESFGSSIYDKLKSIQDGSSDFFNQTLNSALICMLPWFFHDDSSGIQKDVELYPGKGVKVENVNGIKIPDFFRLDPSRYLSFVNIFIDLWERLGNIANPQIGKIDSKEKTATEIMTVIQEGNIKYEYQSQTTKEEFIAVIQTLYDLYYQYMPFNKQFTYNGAPVPIPRQMMRQRVLFRLSGSTAYANKMVERKEAEELVMLAGSSPMLNQLPLLEDLLKAYGKTDIKKYITPGLQEVVMAVMQNPELGQVIQKYMVDKQQLAEAAGVKPKRVAA